MYKQFRTFAFVLIGLLVAGLAYGIAPTQVVHAAGPSWTEDELNTAKAAAPDWRRSFSFAVYRDNGDGLLNIDPHSPYCDAPVQNAQVKALMAEGSEIQDWHGGTYADGWTMREGNFAVTGITGLGVTEWPTGMTGRVLSVWLVHSHGEWPERLTLPKTVNPFNEYVSIALLVK